MSLLFALIGGFLTGLIAKWIMPKEMEKDFNLLQVLLLGFGGSFVSGVLCAILGVGGTGGLIGGVIGACLLIYFIYWLKNKP